MKRSSFIFGTLLLLTAMAFVTDLIWGSLDISPADVLQALTNGSEMQTTNDYVIRNFRLPKALTALFAGAGISIAGLQMQSLFRNPLADTSILGINSGAGLGVALYIMSFTIIPGLSLYSGTADTWGVATAACIGSMLVLLLISAVAAWLRDMVSVLIVGVKVGFLASSFISILQFFSDNEMLKGYLIWSFGSVAGTTWRQLSLMIPIVSGGLFLSMLMPKYMNALNIGENYARSVGIRGARANYSDRHHEYHYRNDYGFYRPYCLFGDSRTSLLAHPIQKFGLPHTAPRHHAVRCSADARVRHDHAGTGQRLCIADQRHHLDDWCSRSNHDDRSQPQKAFNLQLNRR